MIDSTRMIEHAKQMTRRSLLGSAVPSVAREAWLLVAWRSSGCLPTTYRGRQTRQLRPFQNRRPVIQVVYLDFPILHRKPKGSFTFFNRVAQVMSTCSITRNSWTRITGSVGTRRTAFDRHDIQAGFLSGRQADMGRKTLRRTWHLDWQHPASYAVDRRRYHDRSINVDRGDQSRSGGDLHQHRFATDGTSVDGCLAELRAGARQRELPRLHGVAQSGDRKESGATTILAALG